MGVDINCINIVLNNDTRSVTYFFDVTVTNMGFGSLYDVDVYYNDDLLVTFDRLSPGESNIVHSMLQSDFLDVTTQQAIVYAYPYPNRTGEQLMSISDQSQCPVLNPFISANVTKSCDTSLAVSNYVWAVKVNFSGNVCNDGEVVLDNVTISDDRGTSFPEDDIYAGLGTLYVGECVSYLGYYFPNSSYSSPRFFRDRVTVTGHPPFFLNSVTVNTSAQCETCV